MSRSSNQNQLFINDGKGNQLSVSTGTFVTPAINMTEKRRLSFTIGMAGSTGPLAVPTGGFTGVLLVQGTNELPNAGIATGTAWAGVPVQPGQNAYTGAVYWNTLAGGTVNITQGITSLQLDFTDIGCGFIRLAFNNTGLVPTATGTLGGSGTMNITYTAKAF